MPELVLFRREQELLKLTIERGRMVLGREASCELTLPDPDLSPQQVALTYGGARCLLEDLSGQ